MRLGVWESVRPTPRVYVLYEFRNHIGAVLWIRPRDSYFSGSRMKGLLTCCDHLLGFISVARLQGRHQGTILFLYGFNKFWAFHGLKTITKPKQEVGL